MKVKELIKIIETFAPVGIQESWDNSGLIAGDPEADISGVLLSLDVTEAIMDEARELGCNTILTHHPMVFSGMKKFSGADPVSRMLRRAIKEDFVIYAAHTSLDQVPDGISGAIAEDIGLVDTEILAPRAGDLLKLVTFIPEDHYELVSRAVFEAGAGNIGKYDSCGFSTSGTGSFRAGKGANPFSGEMGKINHEPERRFETVLPKFLRNDVVAALTGAHPYEEVAYDLYPLLNENPAHGLGIVGNLQEPVSEVEFLKTVKKLFAAQCIRHSDLLGREVRRVAVCGGSGSEFLQQAVRAGADVYITADVKYHQFFDADRKILLLDIGHFESEQVALRLLSKLFLKKITNFAVHLSKISTNPINYF